MSSPLRPKSHWHNIYSNRAPNGFTRHKGNFRGSVVFVLETPNKIVSSRWCFCFDNKKSCCWVFNGLLQLRQELAVWPYTFNWWPYTFELIKSLQKSTWFSGILFYLMMPFPPLWTEMLVDRLKDLDRQRWHSGAD